MFALFLCLCGLVATYASVVLESNAWSQVITPFGWPRLAAAQALTALPLAWGLAQSLPRPRDDLRAAFFVTSALLGVTLAGLLGYLGSAAGILLESSGQDFLVRAVFRTLWCVVLLTPWCVAAVTIRRPPPVRPADRHPNEAALGSGARSHQVAQSAVDSRRRGSTAEWLVALVTALVAPGLYAYECCRTEASEAAEQLGRGRIERTLQIVSSLADVAYRGPVLGSEPVRVRQALTDQLDAMQIALRIPLPPEASPAERTARAMVYVGLQQPAAARKLLAALPDDLDAVLMLALVDQDLNDASASDADYRKAIELGASSSLPRGQLVDRLRRAYDGLAYNARHAQRFGDAAAIYHEALVSLPELAGYWHYQLGEHHKLGGRPIQAANAFQRAAQLDPDGVAAEARARLRELHEQSPACLLWNRSAGP